MQGLRGLNRQHGEVAQLRITEKCVDLIFHLSTSSRVLRESHTRWTFEKSRWRSNEWAGPHLRDCCSGGGNA